MPVYAIGQALPGCPCVRAFVVREAERRPLRSVAGFVVTAMPA